MVEAQLSCRYREYAVLVKEDSKRLAQCKGRHEGLNFYAETVCGNMSHTILHMIVYIMAKPDNGKEPHRAQHPARPSA